MSRIKWTNEQKRLVGECLTQGMTGEEIGHMFGTSRNAILGLVCRTPELKALEGRRKNLSRRQVREIRSLLGTMKQTEIAKLCGVSNSTVTLIKYDRIHMEKAA